MTHLPDGVVHMPPLEMFSGGSPELFRANAHVLDDDGDVVMSLGALLVETGDRRVLIDLALGHLSIDYAAITDGVRHGGMSGGSLIESLASCGLTPGDIDTVLISHLHMDHVGWFATDTAAGVELTFGNAEYFVTPAEWDFWRSPARSGEVSPRQLDAIATRVTPFEARLSPLAEGECPAPGINALLTPGHTPGHCSFVISSGTDRAVVLGGLIHCPLEISNPELSFVGDVDPALAIVTRDRIDRELDAPHTIAAGGHFPALVFGRVLAGAAGRRVESFGSSS